jgi:hypothetical protein
MWHGNDVSKFHERFCNLTLVGWAVVEMHNQSFSVRVSPSRKEWLMERLNHVGSTIHAVHFGTGRELINTTKPCGFHMIMNIGFYFEYWS